MLNKNNKMELTRNQWTLRLIIFFEKHFDKLFVLATTDITFTEMRKLCFILKKINYYMNMVCGYFTQVTRKALEEAFFLGSFLKSFNVKQKSRH